MKPREQKDGGKRQNSSLRGRREKRRGRRNESRTSREKEERNGASQTARQAVLLPRGDTCSSGPAGL